MDKKVKDDCGMMSCGHVKCDPVKCNDVRVKTALSTVGDN
jgi:hypothetical protein